MYSRSLAQQIIERQCDNVTELIRINDILKLVHDEMPNKSKQKELVNNAISKVNRLIENL